MEMRENSQPLTYMTFSKAKEAEVYKWEKNKKNRIEELNFSYLNISLRFSHMQKILERKKLFKKLIFIMPSNRRHSEFMLEF